MTIYGFSFMKAPMASNARAASNQLMNQCELQPRCRNCLRRIPKLNLDELNEIKDKVDHQIRHPSHQSFDSVIVEFKFRVAAQSGD